MGSDTIISFVRNYTTAAWTNWFAVIVFLVWARSLPGLLRKLRFIPNSLLIIHHRYPLACGITVIGTHWEIYNG
jgi:hypothetical protein